MSNNIEGKIIIITGASSGLGAAAARHLSPLGATLVLGARRIERIQSLAQELMAGGKTALAVATDVTAEVAVPADSFARVVAVAISQPADIDINEILYRPTRQEY